MDRDAYIFHAPTLDPADALVRLVAFMGLDPDNPFRAFLDRGDTVVVKPNLVHHRHYGGGRLEWVITDPALVRAVCEFAFLAVGTSGRVIVGDAPLQSADWGQLMRATGLGALPDHYRRHGYDCTLADFRTVATTDSGGFKHHARELAGDPNGYRGVNLGRHSLHSGRPWRRFRVTNYDPHTMTVHHNEDRHEYLVAGSVLQADAVINLAKLKTHRKAGLTCALKNMVGVNGSKDWLPHHTAGGGDKGGDEYPANGATWQRLSSWIVEREETAGSVAGKLALHAARKLIHKAGASLSDDPSSEGSWYGNDTLWRTILDLNRTVRYAGADGRLRETPQRTVFTIVDAMIAGEGEGPMSPDPVRLDCLVAGLNPVAVETAATTLAGWFPHELRHITGCFGLTTYPLVTFASDDVRIHASQPLDRLSRTLRPSRGWSRMPSREVLSRELASPEVASPEVVSREVAPE